MGEADTLIVRARNPERFFAHFTSLVLEEHFEVGHLETLDDSAHAVLGYLLGGSRGKESGTGIEDGGYEDRGWKTNQPATCNLRHRPGRRSSILDSPSSILHPRCYSWRAWVYLVWLCFQRQAQARQMVWIALALLGFSATVVVLVTAANGWDMRRTSKLDRRVVDISYSKDMFLGFARSPLAMTTVIVQSYGQVAAELELMPHLGTWPSSRGRLAGGHFAPPAGWCWNSPGFMVFSNWVVFYGFLELLVPIWSLSFATDTLGGEREAGTLVWLLTRPMSRPAIYLAKFVALLALGSGSEPGRFRVLCLAAGQPGRLAFSWYWPASLGNLDVLCPLSFDECLFPPAGRGGHCLFLFPGIPAGQHARLHETYQHQFLYPVPDVRAARPVWSGSPRRMKAVYFPVDGTDGVVGPHRSHGRPLGGGHGGVRALRNTRT